MADVRAPPSAIVTDRVIPPVPPDSPARLDYVEHAVRAAGPSVGHQPTVRNGVTAPLAAAGASSVRTSSGQHFAGAGRTDHCGLRSGARNHTTYSAFREVARVTRTVQLLRHLSDAPLHERSPQRSPAAS
ncbi:hypothetical protein ACFYXF_47925 [Streptomyces sp. NPDC002680]|uniref:hypothetical protein n=1 Tax=Streptomyces sp. NPDC002680 TaxID=3364659 RepID=UPI003691AA91